MTDTIHLRLTAEDLAKRFHEHYERLAPAFGYKTRKASAVPWDEVPQQNKALMTAVCQTILDESRDAGWLSVAETLPPLDESVVLILDDGRVILGSRDDCGEEGWLWSRERDTPWWDNEKRIWQPETPECDDLNPVMWHPLPTPPLPARKGE